MLKKLSVLLFLCALCMWAADFWTTKPFTEWNEKEVQKILSDSPWTAKITISGGFGGGRSPTAGGGGGGGGGWWRRRRGERSSRRLDDCRPGHRRRRRRWSEAALAAVAVRAESP